MTLLTVKTTYDLSLTPAEFRLVMGALLVAGGAQPPRPEHQADCLALQQRFFDMRSKQVAAFAATVAKMDPDAQAAGPPQEDRADRAMRAFDERTRDKKGGGS